MYPNKESQSEENRKATSQYRPIVREGEGVKGKEGEKNKCEKLGVKNVASMAICVCLSLPFAYLLVWFGSVRCMFARFNGNGPNAHC